MKSVSYKFLDHTTDAFIEVTADTLESAFTMAAKSVVETTLDPTTIEEKEERLVEVSGQDLRFLLYNWLEEVIYQLITKGFAISRFEITISKNSKYTIKAKIFGEKIDLKKHRFRVEIKAPTFHEMQIKQEDTVTLRFLLDL